MTEISYLILYVCDNCLCEDALWDDESMHKCRHCNQWKLEATNTILEEREED